MTKTSKTAKSKAIEQKKKGRYPTPGLKEMMKKNDADIKRLGPEKRKTYYREDPGGGMHSY
jgi:hypothetical protein